MGKLSIDVEMNSEGLVRGAQQAARATDDLDKSTKEYLESFGSLKKQMNAAKKEAQNLAAQFALLSKEEKSSEFGKNLKAQMDLAIEKAGELQDVMTDTNQAIKNAASDTAGWDAMKDAMEIGKSATLAYAGAIAKLTGNEESLKDVIATLTMVENGFNAAIKIGNAVQKQSAIMTGIRRIQNLAAAKAIEAEKSATIGATAAQRVFNAVAKANPYVLLATVAIAAATAIGGYMLATKKATKTDEEAAKKTKELKEARESYISSMSSSFGNLMGQYNKLKIAWKNLSSEHAKAEWIKKNKTKLDELGLSIKNVKDGEAAFGNNTANVIDGFRKRAQAAALAAQAVQLYAKSLEIEQQATERYNAIKKEAGDKATNTDFNEGRATLNDRTGAYEYTAEGAAQVNKELFQTDKILKGLYDDYDQINNRIDDNLRKQEQISKTVKNVEGSTSDTKDTKVKTTVDPNIKLSENVGKQIQQDLAKKVKEINSDTTAAWKEMKVNMKIDDKSFDLSKIGNIQSKIQDAVMPKKPIDFSLLLPSEQNDAEKALKKFEELDKGIEIASKAKAQFMKEGNSEGVRQMTDQIETLTEQQKEYGEEVSKAAEKNDNIKTKVEEAQKLSEVFDIAGNSIGQFGNAFSMLGQALGSEGLQIAGLIAETIANIMLSFSEALIQAAAMGPWVWIPFGIQGIAQVAAMVAQIKNIAADSMANGGVLRGGPTAGDMTMFYGNAGEMIFNSRQQKRLYDIANGMISLGNPLNGTNGIVGIIRGKDILLVEKNTNSILRKSGQNILM